MRILPLLFVLGALSLRPALAQSKAKATPILYSRDLPKSVLKLMPRGAKSLFWGTFSPRKGSALMAIHLFNRKQQEKENAYIRLLAFDLFQRKGRAWQKINRLPVEYLPTANGSTLTVNAQFLWIDRQRTLPLIKLRVFISQAGDGPLGDEVAVAFPHSFTSPASAQSWTWGSWSSSSSFGQVLDWSRRDKKGFLQVTVKVLLRDEFAPKQEAVWHWRNGEFTPYND